jgi:hypothetical protein
MDLVSQRAAFQYEPLPSGRSIRLLKLHPEVTQDLRHCSVLNADLDSEELQYEAISYAWADSTGTHSLFYNGSEFAITRSLFTALQRFRYARQTRLLWADAVCIDQESIPERNSQVRLVRLTYKKASYALAWFG